MMATRKKRQAPKSQKLRSMLKKPPTVRAESPGEFLARRLRRRRQKNSTVRPNTENFSGGFSEGFS